MSLLGEPPKDYRISLNPYLNLHSLLPSSNWAGKETRGWGGSGRGRCPPEPPLPSPAVPGGGNGNNSGSKAFPVKSRLLSPIVSNRLPLSQDCLTAMALSTPRMWNLHGSSLTLGSQP